MSVPSAASMASFTAGYVHSGACDANRGHHATLPSAPLSAGFSTAQIRPAACAVATSRAVKSARRLCFAT
eukprot:2924761-Pleurochrysis_carterae.AAC.1